MKLCDIMQEINRLKRQGKVFSNYYNNISVEENEDLETLRGSNSIIFTRSEQIELTGQNLKRVYFCGNDSEEISSLLQRVDKNSVIDVLSRNRQDMEDILINGCFSKYAVFERISRRHTKENIEQLDEKLETMKELYDEKKGWLAKLQDADDILDKLTEVFDPYTYHLCNREELELYIQNGWVWIHRREKEIVTIQINKVEGKKKYGYYMYNAGELSDLYSVQRKNWEEDKKNGIVYFFGWQDVKNRKARTVNHFWENEPDGLYDVVYIKQ